MSLKKFNPLLKVGIQDFFDPTADINKAVATDAVIMKDSTGNKKWSIQHNTNTVKQDFYSPEPDNKITNGGFETDLSSWSKVPSYTLNDQFTTDRVAGAVNGTSAEPTGGTRTVVDTNSKISIASGLLSFPTGTATYDAIRYSVITRTSGKILVFEVIPIASDVLVGFDNDTSGLLSDAMRMGVANSTIYSYSGNGPAIGSFSLSTNYKVALILRSTGAFYFIKGGGFTNWTLLYIDPSGSDASLYPAMQNRLTTSSFTADNIRIPTATWLPSTGVTFDTFT